MNTTAYDYALPATDTPPSGDGRRTWGVVRDLNTVWWPRFGEALERHGVSFRYVDIERSDWLEQIADIDRIIWRPNLQDPFLRQAREKLHLMETVLGKQVYPSQQTFWLYDNKNAEAYLSSVHGIKMAPYFVSYCYDETVEYLKNCEYPLVSKSADGAASSNVRLWKDYRTAKRSVDRIFHRTPSQRLLHKIFKRLGVSQSLIPPVHRNYVHLQKFLANNPRDFRITTIGDRHVFGFFRQNRKGDFRASGSGSIDYRTSEHDLEALQYFLEVSREQRFDSMAYDIVYDGSEFVTVELSYTFSDQAIHDCDGHYVLTDGRLNFTEGQVWPQDLIVEHLLSKWNSNAKERDI